MPKVFWEAKQVEVVKSYFSKGYPPLEAREKICQETGRSWPSVLNKAFRLGLLPYRRWTREQDEFLEKNQHLTLERLTHIYNQTSKKTKWPKRTKLAIKKRMEILGLQHNSEHLNIAQIAAILGCSHSKIRGWIAAQPKILKPEKCSDGVLISRKNLRAFLIKFRAELASLNPDPIAFLDILVGTKVTKEEEE